MQQHLPQKLGRSGIAVLCLFGACFVLVFLGRGRVALIGGLALSISTSLASISRRQRARRASKDRGRAEV